LLLLFFYALSIEKENERTRGGFFLQFYKICRREPLLSVDVVRT